MKPLIKKILQKFMGFDYYLFVFEGALKTLLQHKRIIYCKLWKNENRDKCLHLLHNIGYRPKVLHQNKLITLDASVHQQQNFFFIHEQSEFSEYL